MSFVYVPSHEWDSRDLRHHWGELASELNNNRRYSPAEMHYPRLAAPRLFLPPSDFGDSYCGCYMTKNNVEDCTCGEIGQSVDWTWDRSSKTMGTLLQNDNRDIRFHVNYSGGTAAIRGTAPMTFGQHYWEVKMTSQVYGTDMMVGVGTETADIHRLSDKFCSILGSDNETWGLSYRGLFHHMGQCHSFAPCFGQGSIIGVHLDMWEGTLAFYKNRQPLGIACTGLKGKKLYAMVSSTAARSGMRLIKSVSFPSSLQYLCCRFLRSAIPLDKRVLDVVDTPPGLKCFLDNNLSWLLGDEEMYSSDKQTTKHAEPPVTGIKAALALSHITSGCQSEPSVIETDSSDEFVPMAERPSTDLLEQQHNAVLQNLNRHMSSRQSKKAPNPRNDSGEDSDDSIMREVKKCKFSTDYLVDSSESSDVDMV